MTREYLSEAQREMLEDVHRTGDPFDSVVGMAQHGGRNGTMYSLRRRGLIKEGDMEWELTEAGALARETGYYDSTTTEELEDDVSGDSGAGRE